MEFTKEQIELLNEPILGKNVKERAAGWGGEDNTLAYVEGYHVIAEANRIFGLVIGAVKLLKQLVFKTNPKPSVT